MLHTFGVQVIAMACQPRWFGNRVSGASEEAVFSSALFRYGCEGAACLTVGMFL